MRLNDYTHKYKTFDKFLIVVKIPSIYETIRRYYRIFFFIPNRIKGILFLPSIHTIQQREEEKNLNIFTRQKKHYIYENCPPHSNANLVIIIFLDITHSSKGKWWRQEKNYKKYKQYLTNSFLLFEFMEHILTRS